ncbi:MAG: peptidylprolyl isomerase [Polyangiaceae bacterium]
MPPVLGKLAREPLLHFLVVGALLFALERAVGPRRPAPAKAVAGAAGEPGQAERRIVVDQRIREALSEEWAAGHGRPPTADELGALVDRWLEDEMLFREGLLRGLDRDDPRVRERVKTKMALIFETQVSAPEPTRADLEAYFASHADRYARPELFAFVQVFVAGDGAEASARAGEILGRLRAGAAPDGLGDTFSGGRRYRRRKLPDLAEAFGDDFAAGLGKMEPGTWELLRSRHGLHLLRVEERTAARAPALSEVERDVRRDWQTEQRGNALGLALAELRKQWVVVRE